MEIFYNAKDFDTAIEVADYPWGYTQAALLGRNQQARRPGCVCHAQSQDRQMVQAQKEDIRRRCDRHAR